MIAALYVETGGCYFGLLDVDPWDRARDARLYAGPHPVIAHPPCERWGRYWGGGPSAKVRRQKGDDAGCFAAALGSVRKWGGVLEHPEASHAWTAFDLNRPPHNGGWVAADFHGGWTCRIDQGHFGHRARKATWLYAVRSELPALPWHRVVGADRLDLGYHSAEERKRAIKTGIRQRLGKKECAATPHPFRELLLSMARSVSRRNVEDARSAQ